MKQYTRTIYFSPDDDTTGAFLAFVGTAQKKIRIADYSFNLPELVDLLIQKHQAGVDVALVLDRSQAAGPTEVPQVERLKAAGVPHVIGTSIKHKIMHSKFCVVDDVWVQHGSWNMTAAASAEDNFYEIENNQDLAALYLTNWLQMWNWISANEPQS